MLGSMPEYRPMLVVDMDRSAGRGDVALHENRQVLDHAVREALRESGVDWEHSHRQDTGDGVRLVAGPGVPKAALIHPFADGLATRLRTHNLSAGPLNTIRVRVAVHAGDVHVSDGQVVGGSLEFLARLESAPPLKAALNSAPKGVAVALAVSDHIYQEVVRHRYPGIDPDTYHRVGFTVKETQAIAWLHLPGYVGGPLGSEPAPDAPVDANPFAGIRATSVNLAMGNSRVGEQIGSIGTRVDHVSGPVHMTRGPQGDPDAELRVQIAELRHALMVVRQSGELDEVTADAAEDELRQVDAELASRHRDGRRVVNALRKLKGLVDEIADLATRVAAAIVVARSL